MSPKLISNQINPHFTLREAFFSASQVLKNPSEKDLDFGHEFGTKNYVLAGSARTLLREVVKIVEPEKSKKIAIPSFICAVVALPFLAEGYEIEWIEVDENGLIEVADLKAKIKNVSAVLVPHIFGQEAPIKEIYELSKTQNHEVLVIEDEALCWRDKNADKYFDVKIKSFGREKVVSCVSGGALIWPENSAHSEEFRKISLKKPTKKYVIQHLLQPLVYSLAQPWWHLGGKVIPMLALQLGLIPMAVYAGEKEGKWVTPDFSLSPKLQQVLKRQLGLKAKKQKHSLELASYWKQKLTEKFKNLEVLIPDNPTRLILKNLDPEVRKKISSVKGFHFREWDGRPIAPLGTDLVKFGYQTGACPRAEKFARSYLTLPTNLKLDKSDIDRFISGV